MKAALFFVALPLAGCGHIDVISHLSAGGGVEQRVVGTGPAVSETRKAQAATAAEFSGALRVEIRRGAPALTVTAQREILPHIKSSFEGGRLRVWTEGNMDSEGEMRVVFTTPSLSEIQASGATTVEGKGIDASKLKLTLSGASRATLSGRAERIDASLSGASDAALADLSAKGVSIVASGASKAAVRASEALATNLSGASQVRYYGNPSNKTSITNGASSVSAG